MTISNIEIRNRKTNTTTIRFDSDILCTAQIKYSIDFQYNNLTTINKLNYFHIIELNGLTEGTTYNFIIITTDYNDILQEYGNQTFTTRTQNQLDNDIITARGDGQLLKVYYISNFGNDSNDGLSKESTRAFKTISKGISVANVGDIINVIDDGTYIEQIYINKSGIDIAPIVIRGDPSNTSKPTIQGNNIGIGITIEGIGNTYSVHDIIVEDFHLTGFSLAGVTSFSTDIKFNKIDMDNVGYGDANVYNVRQSKYFTFSNSNFHGFGGNLGYNGLEFVGWQPDDISRSTTHSRVINCKFYDFQYHGAFQYDQGVHKLLLENIEFYNCNGGTTCPRPFRGSALAANIDSTPQKANEHIVYRNIITDNSVPLTLANVNGGLIENLIETNTISHQVRILGLYGFYCDNVIFLNNKYHRNLDATGNCDYDWGWLSTVRNITFDGCEIINSDHVFGYDWRIDYGVSGNPVIFRNEVENIYYIFVGAYGTGYCNIEYSDGKVFTYMSYGLSIIPPIHTPQKSEMLVNGSGNIIQIIAYNIYVKPDAGTATANVTKFDTTLPKGNTIIEFSTTSLSNINYTIDTLKSNTEYIIQKNGIEVYRPISNGDGKISFKETEGVFSIIEGELTGCPQPTVTLIIT